MQKWKVSKWEWEKYVVAERSRKWRIEEREEWKKWKSFSNIKRNIWKYQYQEKEIRKSCNEKMA